MKKKKALLRELLLVSLPGLLILGALCWRNLGLDFQVGPHLAAGSEGITFVRQGPLASQNSWNDNDFRFYMGLVKRGIPSGAFSSTPQDPSYQQFVDDSGHTLTASRNATAFLPPSIPTASWLNRYGMTSRVSCDLDRVPTSRGEITLWSRFIVPGGFQSFSVVVRPAWFCRASQTLHLQSARWLPATQQSAEGVEIKVRTTQVANELALEDQSQGSVVSWRQERLNDAHSVSVPHATLLYNWSPRFQSNDGKYDSHDERDARTWAVILAPRSNRVVAKLGAVTQALDFRTTLDGFRPLVHAQLPQRSGNTITLIYRFEGLRLESRAQQFITDIGVPGDGFLHVQVAVPAHLNEN